MSKKLSDDINNKLIINLRNLSHTMRSLYEGRGSILIILNETGCITQRKLTQRLGIQPGSASEVISKLEGRGLIYRQPSETDHRTSDILLTEEGEKRAVEALEQRNSRHKEMFSCLSDGEKQQFLFLLEKVNEDWERRYRNQENSTECGRKNCDRKERS